jgi:capsular polysaccharide biosynthesis protein
MEMATVAWMANAVWRRRWLVLVVLVVLIAADCILTWQSPRSYMARTSLLIGPSTTVDPGQLVYSVDALGRSMIVGTYANVLDTDVIRGEALSQAGVMDANVDIKSAALADSAVVQVTAVARDPDTAAAVANAVGQVGRVRMQQLYPMYDLTVVTRATPPTRLYRPDVQRNLSVGLLLGLCASVSAACAVEWWATARTSR